MYNGSCLCGEITFEIKSTLKAVTNCHCKMCQKQHGAAFATYGSIPKADVVYLSGGEKLASFNSSEGVERKFCRDCGSNIEWRGSSRYPEWTSIALASIDTPLSPEKVRDVHEESAVCWQNNR